MLCWGRGSARRGLRGPTGRAGSGRRVRDGASGASRRTRVLRRAAETRASGANAASSARCSPNWTKWDAGALWSPRPPRTASAPSARGAQAERGRRIAAAGGNAIVVDRGIASSPQGHHRIGPETESPAPATHRHALLPIAPSGRLHPQMQPEAVVVLPRSANRLDEGHRQSGCGTRHDTCPPPAKCRATQRPARNDRVGKPRRKAMATPRTAAKSSVADGTGLKCAADRKQHNDPTPRANGRGGGTKPHSPQARYRAQSSITTTRRSKRSERA